MSKVQYHKLLEKMKQKIEGGELNINSKLPTMSELAEQYKVGNSTVREVYRALESKGYVAIQQGRGTFVTYNRNMRDKGIDRSNLIELLKVTQVRIIIEPSFAALAAREAYIHEINQIVESAEKMKEMAAQNELTANEDMRFHRLIVEATHNEYALKLYNNLNDELKRIRNYTKKLGMVEKAVHYHQMIAEAISKRDSNNAKMLMESHLQSNNEVAMFELDGSTSRII